MERRGAGLAALGALGRRLLWALPAYAAGLLGLGAGALVLALALYAGWRRRRRARERGLRLAARLQRDEEAAVRAAAAAGLGAARGELPAWVSFPDVERAEWLNKVLAQAWPFFGQYMEKLLVENVAPSIRASNSHLQTFAFTKVDMGEKPLRVLGVRAHPGAHKKQILLDLNISYVGDVQIDVEVKKFFCKAGVKGMQLHGMLRIILEPLLGDVPIVGALTMFFIRRPTLDINWTGMTNLLDIPGLSSMSDTMIMDAISSYLVLPNRLLVPLVPDLHEAAQLRCPLPRGVVRVHLRAARDLRSKDRFMGGLVEGKSDPYAVLRVGTQVVTSRVIDNNLNPTWDEVYEFVVHEVPGQEMEVELFDKDPDQDDLLGRMKLDFGEVLKARVLEEWFPLQEGGRGRLHLRLEWLSLMSDASKLDQVLERNRTIVAKPDPPSAAILVVYLDRAEELPMKKPGKEPNPMVQVSVQDVTRESKVIYNTSAPVWEDAFRFFLHDPVNQDVDIQVKDDPRQSSLGSLSLPLARLLDAPELTLDQPFQLQRSGPGSRLYMKLVLRVLFFDAPENGGPPPTPPGQPDPPASTGGTHRPPHASPDPQFGSEHVLRIHLLEAENLIAKDNFFKGVVRGRSDPYAKVRVAGRVFRSRVVKEDLNPRWNEVYEVIVDNVPGQDVEFDLFDKDIDKDDFLGRCKVPLRRVLSSRIVDEWLPLEEVKSGRLHVRLENLTPSPSAALLEQVLHTNSLLQPARGEELSAALLSVFVDRAADLPLRKGSKPPAAFASLAVRDVSVKTKTCTPTAEPVWDEGFSFLIKRPHVESLELQVKEEGGQPLGALSLPLPQLLASEGLALDGWFPLAGGGPGSQVLLRAQLGVLVSQQPAEAPGEEECGAGGLRQRLLPADSPPEPAEGPRGRLQLTLWYHGDEHKLVAIVHACRKLRPVSKELPDPYVSLVLLPDRSRGTKRKTSVQKKTLNPDFNERFEWDMSLEEASRRKLEAHVKSTLSFMSREKEALGKLHLDLAQVDLSEGGTHWYELRDERSSP
ncbi:LOW QUALITY PROTEIN: extended synaptotagmin-1 [Gavia stellata]|uniref:LOW QUALITY PROTEIN: extended synaptotagmin-1 n=1 Tax=Gavia stellata TaxID=37040 RepID=UPI00289906D7|nr:LOW QUALITY PROTEIN: extended synaptotagmin-1 [Gavia stellata]